MDEIWGDRWCRQGSSLVWNPEQLDAAVRRGVSVALSAALGWLNKTPVDPPNEARDIVITGLATALDQLPANEADQVLERTHRLIRRLQAQWPDCALIFAAPDGGFQEASPNGPIMLTLRN